MPKTYEIDIAALYGAHFKGELLPNTRNIFTGQAYNEEKEETKVTTQSNSHHCDGSTKGQHAVKKSCYENGHLAFCCVPIYEERNGVWKLRWCGERFAIVSPGGCSSHPYGRYDNNQFLRDFAKNRSARMPDLVPTQQPEYYQDRSFHGLPLDRYVLNEITYLIELYPVESAEESRIHFDETTMSEKEFDGGKVYEKYNEAKKRHQGRKEKPQIQPRAEKKTRKLQPAQTLKDMKKAMSSKFAVQQCVPSAASENSNRSFTDYGGTRMALQDISNTTGVANDNRGEDRQHGSLSLGNGVNNSIRRGGMRVFQTNLPPINEDTPVADVSNDRPLAAINMTRAIVPTNNIYSRNSARNRARSSVAEGATSIHSGKKGRKKKR